MKEGFKKTIRYSIAAILVIVSVYYAIRGVDFNELWRILVNTNYLWAILPVPIILLSHWVRALRWKTMLEPALKAKTNASTWNLFSAVMIGYFLNCVLPRGGEFLRPYIFARRQKISFSTTFATIIAERFIDLISLVALFGIVFLFFSHQVVKVIPSVDPRKILVPTIIILAVLVLSFYPPFVRAILRIFVKPFSHVLFEKINHLFEKFLKGFAIIKTPSQYFRLTIETAIIWAFYTIPLYLTFFAFGFQENLHLGFDAAIFLIIVSGIGVTIAPTPGAIGIYHLLIQNAMINLYGISREEALAFATVTHTINYLVQVLVGGMYFLRENIKKIPQNIELEAELEIPAK